MKNALRGAKLRPSTSSESHRRSRFAKLREIFAKLQSSHRDLSIDTLPAVLTSRVLRLCISRTRAGCRQPYMYNTYSTYLMEGLDTHVFQCIYVFHCIWNLTSLVKIQIHKYNVFGVGLDTWCKHVFFCIIQCIVHVGFAR